MKGIGYLLTEMGNIEAPDEVFRDRVHARFPLRRRAVCLRSRTFYSLLLKLQPVPNQHERRPEKGIAVAFIA